LICRLPEVRLEPDVCACLSCHANVRAGVEVVAASGSLVV
jgi:hypothetical protein